MTRFVDVDNSKFQLLLYLKDTAYKNIVGKGWSWSYVYNFVEIRNIYLALKKWNCIEFDLKKFYKYCQSIDLPFVQTEWSERRILEHINALKNFGIIDSNEKIIKTLFVNSDFLSSLTDDDLLIFRKIFFEYYRFKEIFSWFIEYPIGSDVFDFINSLNESNIIRNSHPIYYFSNHSRFIDSFFYDLTETPQIYYIEKENEDLMRFWDVFLKWGTTLGIIEKFSLRSLDIKTVNGRNISCVYLINDKIDFDFMNFLYSNYEGNYIYLPQLIIDLVIKYRFSIKSIQNIIIEQYKNNKKFLSLERTSEIFIKKKDIKDGEKILFPKYNDSFVSHLIIRK